MKKPKTYGPKDSEVMAWPFKVVSGICEYCLQKTIGEHFSPGHCLTVTRCTIENLQGDLAREKLKVVEAERNVGAERACHSDTRYEMKGLRAAFDSLVAALVARR